MRTFTTKDKATINIVFPKQNFGLFEIYDSNNQLYFFRELTGQDRIKVNIAKADNFTTNINCDTIEVLPLKIHQLDYELPPHQKEYGRSDWKFIYNPRLTGTPARNFYRKGIIEYGDIFLSLPFPIRVFILCHELGHAYYHDESLADIYGAKLFISMGYNNSTAFYALRNVLNFQSKRNQDRLTKLFNVLHR